MLFGFINKARAGYLALTAVAILCAGSSCKRSNNGGSVTLNEPFDGEVIKGGQPMAVSLNLGKDAKVDSIQYFINGALKASTKGYTPTTIKPEDLQPGKNELRVLVYGTGTDTLKSTFNVRTGGTPKNYTYKIVNTYSHDTSAYTQGLEVHEGKFLESTGEYGTSTLRWVDIKSGKVLQKTALDSKYFGEGCTLMDGRIAWLTWKENIGFFYNPQSLQQTGTFKYNNSPEGWGLTNDGTRVYKSDGSNNIYTLDAKDLHETGAISVYNPAGGDVDKLNELEFANGFIYANVYETNNIVIINPKSGAVTGIINMEGLLPGNYFKTEDARLNNVLNGIAYDKATGHFFVTGKKWPHMFEVQFVAK